MSVNLTAAHRSRWAEKLAYLGYQIRRSPLTMAGLFITTIVLLCMIFAPWLASHDPNALNLGERLAPPSAEHWFGTDNFGRDILSRLIYGARISLQVGIVSVAISATFGILVGILAGCGLLIGAFSLTGVIASLANDLLTIAGSNVLLLLAMCAITSLVLGLGLTTTACYIFLAILVGPALEKLGLNKMAVHMFIFYWGMLSSITPPVAIASFAAAGIAGAPAMKTGWESMWVGSIIYFIPFFFVAGALEQVENAQGVAGFIAQQRIGHPLPGLEGRGAWRRLPPAPP